MSPQPHHTIAQRDERQGSQLIARYGIILPYALFIALAFYRVVDTVTSYRISNQYSSINGNGIPHARGRYQDRRISSAITSHPSKGNSKSAAS